MQFFSNKFSNLIPVKSDEQTIFTCFLEYEANIVKVHDLVYQKDNNGWKLNKNFYRKLRLSQLLPTLLSQRKS